MLWFAGVITLAGGTAFASAAMLVVGWGSLMAAAALLSTNLLASLRAAPRPLTLLARLLALAPIYLIAGPATALIATIRAGVQGPFVGAPRGALAILLLAGWIGLTVSGALMHLLAILGRIRHFSRAMPRPRPVPERVITAAIGIALATLAISRLTGATRIETPASLLTVACAAALTSRVATLAVSALAPRRTSPTG